jgi:hypothetical protein
MSSFLQAGGHAAAPGFGREADRRSRMRRRAHGVPPGSWPLAALAVAAVSVAPLLVCDAPALLDYPNHLARFFVLAHPHDPALAKMYAPHWALLPNLGADVLGAVLLSVLPVDVGGRILLGLSLLAPVAGALVYARAAFGRWTWWSLGAGAIAFNGLFFLGFMNCLLGLGVALAGAGAWRVLRRRASAPAAMLGGLAIGLTAFFCHLLGFAYFAVLIGAQEAEAVLRLRREQGAWDVQRVVSSTGILAAALGPTLALYAGLRLGHGGDLLWRWQGKLYQLLTPFFSYDRAATTVSAAAIGIVLILLWRRSVRAVGVDLGLGALGVLYLIAPMSAAGGTLLDLRLPLMAALLMFAGMEPRVPPRAGLAIGAIFATVIGFRSAEVTIHWQGHTRDLADLRSVLEPVEPGARLLPVFTDDVEPQPTMGRELPGVARLDEHLGALAVIERRAFWPALFTDPTQQPLAVKAPYDGIAIPSGWTVRWRDLDPKTAERPAPRGHGAPADWRRKYDYLLLSGPMPDARGGPGGLTLVRAARHASLYRIDRAAAAPAAN